MQKIILDTNIVVSALISKNYPFYIVFDYVLNRQVQLCLSKELLNEYREVLFRPKFAQRVNFENNARNVLIRLEKKALLYKPKTNLDILKDKSDNKLLELADESNAHFLITGNNLHFTFEYYKQTQILSPRSFWEKVMN